MIKPQLHHIYKTRDGTIVGISTPTGKTYFPWGGFSLSYLKNADMDYTDSGSTNSSDGSHDLDLVEDLGYCDLSIAGEKNGVGRVAIFQAGDRMAMLNTQGNADSTDSKYWQPAEPETTEINGKRYITKALNERLKELEEVV